MLSGTFIQIGLSACLLIGPFLYLYLKSISHQGQLNWPIHIFPYLIGITIFGYFYNYHENRGGWSWWFVKGIYLQWLFYIVISARFIRPIIEKLTQRIKLKRTEIWTLSVYMGVAIIWVAYFTASYTSYIVGALSFSFVLYLIILLLAFKGQQLSFLSEKEKYKDKEIDSETVEFIKSKISIINEKELFLNPDLTLTETAKELSVSTHTLSQFLNESLGKSFSTFINEHRIEKAKMLLQTNDNYTIESLGYESGFNSKSTFFSTFRKFTGLTPAEFRKTQAN